MLRNAPTKLSAVLLIVILALFALERERVSTRGPALSSTPAVCLNELLPKPCGEVSEEFIELYNPLTVTVAIGGWTLEVASVFGSDTYTLPESTMISATAHIVLPRTVSKLNLPDQNGHVLLLDKASQIVDERWYVSAQCDLSIGRCPDGGDEWWESLTPSPGEANICGTVTPTPTGATLYLPLIVRG